jgi:hypothetical protein
MKTKFEILSQFPSFAFGTRNYRIRLCMGTECLCDTEIVVPELGCWELRIGSVEHNERTCITHQIIVGILASPLWPPWWGQSVTLLPIGRPIKAKIKDWSTSLHERGTFRKEVSIGDTSYMSST